MQATLVEVTDGLALSATTPSDGLMASRFVGLAAMALWSQELAKS